MQGAVKKFMGLFKRRPRLFDVEKAIFDALLNELPKEDARILMTQIGCIAAIQRLADGVESDFYMSEEFESLAARLHGPDEFLLAKIVLYLPIFSSQLEVDVRCVSGRIFSFEYKGSVNYYEEALGMDPAPELIVEVTLLER